MLMILVDLGLILTYMCVLLIKTCEVSSEACAMFGFGDSPNGVPSETHAAVRLHFCPGARSCCAAARR